MTLPWHAHGAARVAAGLARVGTPYLGAATLPESMQEALARADVSPAEQHLAWELSRGAPELSPPDRLALEGLVLLLFEALARGSTRVALAQLPARAALILGDRELGHRMQACAQDGTFDRLVGPDRPMCIERGFVYSDRVLAVEVRLAGRIRAQLERGAGAAPEARRRALADVLERPAIGPRGPVVLNAGQRRAVESALDARLLVISGGPGTGKTSVVVSILRAAVASGSVGPGSIALAAPTGKAADRMRGAIESALAGIEDPLPTDAILATELPTPRTLHRLLAYSPALRRFRRGAQSPLSERLVVLDESSMIDVFMMERVLAALHPSAQLILLGDTQQLPSVAAGAVFRDLSGRVPSVHLEESHRVDPARPEGAHILEVAGAFNRGVTPTLDGPGVRLLEADASGREGFLRAWFERVSLGASARRTFDSGSDGLGDRAGLERLFTASERAILLCITRRGWRPSSVRSVNAALHREATDDVRWVAGEPVVVGRNDYERGVFNGDRGLLLWVARAPERARLCAVFRQADGFVAHPLETIRSSLELGWATTVHKAQGSEFDEVALLLPERDHPRLLTREVIYTAVTRARRGVQIIGSLALLSRAVTRQIHRSTGIAERITAGGDLDGLDAAAQARHHEPEE